MAFFTPAVIASIIGATGAIGGGYLAGRNGGGGGGGGGGAGVQGATNPAFNDLASLFGQQLYTHQAGDDKGITEFIRNGESIFGNQFKQQVADFINNPLPLNELEEGGYGLAQMAQNLAPDVGANLRQIAGYATEGAETGFRNDIRDLIPQAMRQLRESGAQIGETFSGSNILRGTDFSQALAQEGGDVTEDLIARQVGLDEAAAARRVQLLPIASALGIAEPSFYANLGRETAGIGQNYRGQQEAINQRPLDVFGFLSGLGSPQFNTIGVPSFNQNDSTAGLIGALGQIAPVAVNAFGQGNFGDFGTNVGDIPHPAQNGGPITIRP